MLCLYIPLALPAETDPDPEKKAIKKAALDYIEGSFSGDAERMANALHPELTKVRAEL